MFQGPRVPSPGPTPPEPSLALFSQTHLQRESQTLIKEERKIGLIPQFTKCGLSQAPGLPTGYLCKWPTEVGALLKKQLLLIPENSPKYPEYV